MRFVTIAITELWLKLKLRENTFARENGATVATPL